MIKHVLSKSEDDTKQRSTAASPEGEDDGDRTSLISGAMVPGAAPAL